MRLAFAVLCSVVATLAINGFIIGGAVWLVLWCVHADVATGRLASVTLSLGLTALFSGVFAWLAWGDEA